MEVVDSSAIGGESPGGVNCCTSCPRKDEEDFLLQETIPEIHHKLLRCPVCHKCRGLLTEDGNFLSLRDALRRTTTVGAERESEGWQKVVSTEERRSLFVLALIVHKEEEGDPIEGLEFSLPPITDLVKIRWTNGEAVGFYSVKPEGTFDLDRMSSYAMATLDTIFIRKSHRGRGFGLEALEDLRGEFPCQKIGFSYPLTPSMCRVLWKHLKETTKDRLLFWETTGDVYGTARNVWLTLHRKQTMNISNKL